MTQCSAQSNARRRHGSHSWLWKRRISCSYPLSCNDAVRVAAQTCNSGFQPELSRGHAACRIRHRMCLFTFASTASLWLRSWRALGLPGGRDRVGGYWFLRAGGIRRLKYAAWGGRPDGGPPTRMQEERAALSEARGWPYTRARAVSRPLPSDALRRDADCFDVRVFFRADRLVFAPSNTSGCD